MTSNAKGLRRVDESPCSPALKTPVDAVLTLAEQESVDLIAECRAMASGQSVLLPTLAHVQALVAHLDAVAEHAETLQSLMTEFFADAAAARRGSLSLARLLGKRV